MHTPPSHSCRPMLATDTAAAEAIMHRAVTDAARLGPAEPAPADDRRHRRMVRVIEHLVQTDPGGCWVAARGGQLVGMATSIRRGTLWGLALLFVDPIAQSEGVGRSLLEATRAHAQGADTRMIVSSDDPRAVRAYAASGLEVHPAMSARGRPDPGGMATAAGRRIEQADSAALKLVDEVDLAVRGSSRAGDVGFLMSQGATLRILEDRRGRGYAVSAQGSPVVGGHPMVLAATSEAVAADLLRDALASAHEPVELIGLTRRHNWALQVAFEARLRVGPGPALCISPGIEPPAAWILSGIYF